MTISVEYSNANKACMYVHIHLLLISSGYTVICEGYQYYYTCDVYSITLPSVPVLDIEDQTDKCKHNPKCGNGVVCYR